MPEVLPMQRIMMYGEKRHHDISRSGTKGVDVYQGVASLADFDPRDDSKHFNSFMQSRFDGD
jgi:hypothetical protein